MRIPRRLSGGSGGIGVFHHAHGKRLRRAARVKRTVREGDLDPGIVESQLDLLLDAVSDVEKIFPRRPHGKLEIERRVAESEKTVKRAG